MCAVTTPPPNCVLDVVMQKSTSHRRGITWGLQDRLEDLDYADYICMPEDGICICMDRRLISAKQTYSG